jgi:hypothetical protein
MEKLDGQPGEQEHDVHQADDVQLLPEADGEAHTQQAEHDQQHRREDDGVEEQPANDAPPEALPDRVRPVSLRPPHAEPGP